MTKSWDEVRDEACRLYLSGKTLLEVQKHIKARFNFEASIRSYRSHFAKWGVTRASQLKELRQSTSISRPGVRTRGENAVQDDVYVASSIARSHSLPPESMHVDVPIDDSRQRLKGLQASLLPRNVEIDSTAGSTTALESVYDILASATLSERHRLLEEKLKAGDFDKGKDNVLHYAATRDDPGTLNGIIEFMLSKELSLDLPGSGHRTALEIAIQAGRVVVVKTLLRAKASVNRRNEKKQQPLHFAIMKLASAEICRHLMDAGADINAALSPTERPISPMHMTLDLFLQSRKSAEKDILCGIMQELIDHGAQIMPNGEPGETSLEKFVQASTELDSTSRSVRQQQTRPSSLVGYFLSADRNPLCWFPKSYCPAHECDTLAAFIFGHTPKSGLSAMLIENSDMRMYGLEMIQVLLRPCQMRYSSADDLTVNDLLRNLLNKMKEQQVSGYLKDGLLRHILEGTPKKKRLERLETLLSSGYVSELECREALTRLPDETDDNLRLSMAEPLLLTQFDLANDIPWAYTDFIGFLFSQSSSQIQDFAGNEHAQERLKEYILSKLGITLLAEGANHIVRCVIHVYTKLMLEGSVGRHVGTADRIVYIASRMRQEYGLPAIEVATDLLLELHYITSRPNKHFRGVAYETSDYAGSPETAMSDGSSNTHSPRTGDVRELRRPTQHQTLIEGTMQ